jgi:hypothetical protein
MKLTTLAEPLLEFGTGTHICPRTGIEHMGVYDKRDELRRTELRIGVVGRGEGIDLLDDWLEKCRVGIDRKKVSKLLNLFRGFGGINQNYGFLTKLINSPQYTRTLKKSDITEVVKLASRVERVERAVELNYEQIRFLAENRAVDVIVCVMPNEMFDSMTTAESDEESEENELEHNFRRILRPSACTSEPRCSSCARRQFSSPSTPEISRIRQRRRGTSARRSTTRATGRSRGAWSRIRRS